MKNTKRRLEPLSFYDHTGIEKHLEDMARKGWMIERISNYFWTYHKIEPQELHFTVSYYPKASDFDPVPSEAQQTFMDFCAETKWELACTWFQMQIFYNAKESPTPINTDPTIEVETIHKACKANYLRGYKLLFAISLIATFFFLSSLISDTLRLIASPSDLATGVCCLILFLMSSVELTAYYTWHKKAKKAAEQGIFLETPSTSNFQKVILGITILVLAYWIINLIFGKNPLMAWIALAILLCIYATVILTNTIKRFLKRKQMSAGVNRILTSIASFLVAFVLFGTVLSIGTYVFSEIPDNDLVFYEEVPLRISDLLDTDYQDYLTTTSTDESIFLGRLEFQHKHGFDDEASAKIPELKCEIYSIKLPSLYDFSKGLLKQKSVISESWKGYMKEQDSNSWRAKEAYRFVTDNGVEKSKFLLCYDNTLVLIEFNWEPTAEQMAIIAEKLGS